MKTTPIRKYAHLPSWARVSVYHSDRFSQVEIYATYRHGSEGGYSNSPKAFNGADVRYIDGRWCWVLDDEKEKE